MKIDDENIIEITDELSSEYEVSRVLRDYPKDTVIIKNVNLRNQDGLRRNILSNCDRKYYFKHNVNYGIIHQRNLFDVTWAQAYVTP